MNKKYCRIDPLRALVRQVRTIFNEATVTERNLTEVCLYQYKHSSVNWYKHTSVKSRLVTGDLMKDGSKLFVLEIQNA